MSEPGLAGRGSVGDLGFKAAALSTLLLSVGDAFLRRLDGIGQGVGGDEIFNANTASRVHADLATLREAVIPTVHTVLDYLVRAVVWIPILGQETERAHVLPSVFWSVLSPAVAFGLAFSFFRGRGRWIALGGAAVIAGMIARDGLESWNAREARIYTFASFLSVLWFLAFFRAVRLDRWSLFLFATFLYLNDHFFAWPLVALGASVAIALGFRESPGFGRTLRRLVLPLAAIFLASAWLNWPSYSANLSPVRRNLPEAYRYASDAVVWYWGTYRVPLWAILGAAFALGLRAAARGGSRFGFERTSASRAVLLAIVFAAGNALQWLLVARRSNYEVSVRYFMPLFGLSISVSLACIDAIGEGLGRVPQRVRALAEPILVTTMLVAGSWSDLPGIPERWRRATWPKANYSGVHRYFSEIRSWGKPIFFHAARDEPDRYAWHYLNVIEGPHSAGFRVANEAPFEEVRGFLSANPGATIAFQVRNARSREASALWSPGTELAGRVLWAPGLIGCDVVALRGATAEEALALGRELGSWIKDR